MGPLWVIGLYPPDIIPRTIFPGVETLKYQIKFENLKFELNQIFEKNKISKFWIISNFQLLFSIMFGGGILWDFEEGGLS